jgi:uncharacterized damage-inducible protein DinB
MFSVLDKLSDEQFTSVIQSSFPSIQESVAHIFGAEWIWLMRWNGNSPRADGPFDATKLMQKHGVDVEKLRTVAGLRSFADSLEQQRQEFLRSLTENTLHAPLRYNGSDGKEFSMPLAQLLQHVVNHGTYHRGQVTTLLRQVGAETVSLDMVFFYREQAAATQS